MSNNNIDPDDLLKDGLSEDVIEGDEEWLEEHGHPTYESLQKLVLEGTPESLSKLSEIADDYNVEYNDATTPEELMDLILQAVDEDEEVEENFQN